MSKKKKKKKPNNNKVIILFICIIIVLIISNIYFISIYNKANKEDKITQEILFRETDEDYQDNKKYYATISYKKFKKLYKDEDITTIAILDNTTNTHDKFIEMINKIAYYKNTKIYLLEINKLSKKNTIAFYELDERLSSLETNYILSVSNNQILSITTFTNDKLNKIVEGLGE